MPQSMTTLSCHGNVLAVTCPSGILSMADVCPPFGQSGRPTENKESKSDLTLLFLRHSTKICWEETQFRDSGKSE